MQENRNAYRANTEIKPQSRFPMMVMQGGNEMLHTLGDKLGTQIKYAGYSISRAWFFNGI